MQLRISIIRVPPMGFFYYMHICGRLSMVLELFRRFMQSALPVNSKCTDRARFKVLRKRKLFLRLYKLLGTLGNDLISAGSAEISDECVPNLVKLSFWCSYSI